MLEECITHKQFEYGWKVYEKMGSVLEDRETAKIAMRLCKRAFLGHGGPGANPPGSPNLSAKNIQFEDEFLTQDSINSPERSSRLSKALRVYSHMRSDISGQYQVQLRDPFVMTCMIKAIYDTVLVAMGLQCQNATLEDQRLKASPRHGSEAPKTDLQLQPHSQAMTIGPLIDLAFEIYADMRNVGPIRNLPHLCTKLTANKTSSSHGHNFSNGSTGSLSLFSHSSIRLLASSSLPLVDLSACGSNFLSAESLAAPSAAMIDSDTCVIFQPLNPTLSPTLPGRRLPNELYLALLHLCTQVPLSGIQRSTQVVKIIVADMMATPIKTAACRFGQTPCSSYASLS
ncbi:MAG: hypothetical protein J3Q66DRAFT_426228 [Benniella sp.]|nr:MAG: hypothetical protein J3Q66DRAFT_426228 [Benniella sp.]